MAHFNFAPDRTLTHFAPDIVEPLGQAAPEVKEAEVMGWLASLAKPFDVISTPEGSFVVQAPARWAPVPSNFSQPPGRA